MTAAGKLHNLTRLIFAPEPECVAEVRRMAYSIEDGYRFQLAGKAYLFRKREEEGREYIYIDGFSTFSELGFKQQSLDAFCGDSVKLLALLDAAVEEMKTAAIRMNDYDTLEDVHHVADELRAVRDRMLPKAIEACVRYIPGDDAMQMVQLILRRAKESARFPTDWKVEEKGKQILQSAGGISQIVEKSVDLYLNTVWEWLYDQVITTAYWRANARIWLCCEEQISFPLINEQGKLIKKIYLPRYYGDVKRYGSDYAPHCLWDYALEVFFDGKCHATVSPDQLLGMLPAVYNWEHEVDETISKAICAYLNDSDEDQV